MPAGVRLVLVALALTAGGCRSLPPPAPRVPPAPAAPAGPSETDPRSGVLAGRITSADSGVPLGRARVVVTSPQLAAARVVLTDADGRYRVAGLPAGRYTVTAVKSGFVTGSAQDPGSTGIELAAGEERIGVDIALLRAGVIAGRVLDEDGSPFEGARVEVWRTRAADGRRGLSAVGRAVTDDRGDFRIGGLAPGVYLVSASDPAWDAVEDDRGDRPSYPPTYYPGVALPEEAARIVVLAGGETTGIEFTFRLVRPVRISGRLVAHDERPLVAGALALAAEPTGRTLGPEPATLLSDILVRPDGQFTIRNVPPGRYILRARGTTGRGEPSLVGTFRAEVTGRDLEGVTIVLSPGAGVTGQLEFEATRATSRPAAAGVRVRAVAADGVVFADALSGLVAPDGRFAIDGLMPGAYVFRVEGLPAPWTLESVLLHGRQIVDLPLSLEAGTRVEAVRIVLTDAPAGLEGRVQTPEGHTVAGGSVVVFATDPGLWTPYTRSVAVAPVQSDGRYRLVGLPPAEYWVAAVGALVSRDDLHVSMLEGLLPRATRAVIRAGETRQLDVVAVPAGSARWAQPSSSYSPSAGGATRVDGRSASR